MAKREKFIRTIPKVFKPATNPVVKALVEAFSAQDEEIVNQIQEAKAQLFVRTAEGTYLDRLANARGVSRPASLGLTDPEFQELIPNLSLKAKQIRKTFYDTADVFWGKLFSRANVESSNFAPFNVSVGDTIGVKIDNGAVQEVKVLSGEIATNGAATVEEMVDILGRIEGATISIIEDSVTGNKSINIRTNTPGPRGSVEILDGYSMVGSSKLDLEIKSHELLDQAQRVMIYELRPNELTIEVPAIVPALRRTLKGSHHFHTDGTLHSPSTENFKGSFFFDPDGLSSSYTVTGQKTEISLGETLMAGNVYTKVTVDDASGFETTSGYLIFGWGTDKEEQPVGFRGVPNSKTILLDPSYTFQNTHGAGTSVNVLSSLSAYKPRKDGTDLAIYLTSPSDAREVVQNILKTLAAAGVIVNFVILAPDYVYLQDNPYLTSDDAPSI